MDFNVDQKKAIDHGDGPILVIAGAGSGKTRVITSRILKLINSGACRSSEILALTFTEKAANEMVERIDESMKLGYEELCVKTFHAFCDLVLRNSGMEMGIDPGYKILTQVDQWFFFKKNLFEFDLDYYRPLGNPNRFIYSLLSHFSKLKDELIEPDTYIEYAKKLEESEEKTKMLEIANCYKKYQALLIKNNYLDFGDLTFYANKLLDKRESVLQHFRSKHKYILVDEFQDTNHAQFQLILKLAGEKQNLMVVGDDDQSIYKWRGASLSNILHFNEHFPKTDTVVLGENYRSTSNILDCSYKLIQNNNPDRLEAKLGINKKLGCNIDGEKKVEVHHFSDFIQESSFVAKKIKEIHDAGGCEYRDFVILVRSNSLSYPFVDELKSLGIPFQIKNPKGLFSLDEIKDLISVVKLIANPYDDISLLRMLKMDIFGVSMEEILSLLNKNNTSSLFDVLRQEPEVATLPGTESGLIMVTNLLKDLIEFSKDSSVGAVINKFIHLSGYLHAMVNSEKYDELDNINEFAKQVSKFERDSEDNSVLDFVNYLNLLDEANAVFSTGGFSDKNSVEISTVHGSKGLEFDYVFIVDTVKGRFPTVRRSDPITLPEELTNAIYPEGDFHLQEERRLFYVAMTRARKRLFLTYSDQYEGAKKWKPSPFTEEVLLCESSTQIDHPAEDDAIKRLKDFKEPAKAIFDLPAFKRKRLSYSQFETFKSCPLKYNYRYIMKVPVAAFHAGSFGSSVHETLNEFYREMKLGKPVDIELLRSLYEKNWMPHGYESSEHEAERRKKGLEMLERYFEENSNPWVVPKYLEKPFNVRIGEYLINGRIDRIDKLEDGTYEVIDYKTGKMRNGMKLEKDLQLSIYALACKNVFGIKVSKLSLYYLETLEKISTSRSDEQLNTLEEDVLALIEEMKGSEFQAFPGFHCQFCDFKLICPAV
jgi:DNA helicase II / ATP-dependent DNA helicase PcrA